MKRFTKILFGIGLFLEILAFLLSNSSQMPWMYRIFSLSYYYAQQGLQKLNSDRLLNPEDWF